MLDHFGSPQAARAVENAIETVCDKGPHTPDFGGNATTQDMGKAIAAAVGAGPAERVPEPAVAREFGIAAVTARIDDLYERLAARRTLRTAASPRRRRARLGAGSHPAEKATAGSEQR